MIAWARRLPTGVAAKTCDDRPGTSCGQGSDSGDYRRPPLGTMVSQVNTGCPHRPGLLRQQNTIVVFFLFDFVWL